MAGLTNPQERDLQIRTPVFIVAKDFVSGIRMRTAIAASWAHDVYVKDASSQASSSETMSHFTQSSVGGSKNKVIPFELRNNNGIVPKHQINYVEISVVVGNELATRQTCKAHCELIFKKYSERARSGHRVEALIPHVGKLTITLGMCAVVFNQEIIEATRGKTAINYKERHHTADIHKWNNWMNDKILEKNPNQINQTNHFNQLKSRLDREFEDNTE